MFIILRHTVYVILLTFIYSYVHAAQPVEIKGQLQVIILDDFKNKKSSKKAYIIDEKTGRQYHLQISESKIISAMSGKKIKAKGILSGSELISGQIAYLDPNGQIIVSPSGLHNLTPVIGEQKTLFLLVIPNDKPAPTITVEDYRNMIANQIDLHYRQDSFGQAWLSPQVYGWFTANATASQLMAGPGSAYPYIKDQLIAAGIDTSQYKKVTYAIWGIGGGIALMGGQNNSSGIDPSNITANIKTAVHELGHNFGLEHAAGAQCRENLEACEVGWTADFSDVMGYDMNSLNYFNGGHKERLGWLDTSTGNLYRKVVSASGVYTVKAYNSGTNSSEILKVVTGSAGEPKLIYYLEYRRPTGFDQSLLDYGTVGPTVHMRMDNQDSTFLLNIGLKESKREIFFEHFPFQYLNAYRDFVSSILPGQVFKDPIHKVSFRTISMTDTEAQVEVLIGSTHADAPVLTLLSPSSMITKVGLGAAVDITASATSAAGISSVDFYKTDDAGNRSLVCHSTASPYKCSVLASSSSNQIDEYIVIAKDALGQLSHELPVRIATDTAAPTVCGFSMASGSVTPGTNINLNYNFLDGNFYDNRSHIEVRVNNEVILRQSGPVSGNTSAYFWWYIPNVANATYNLEIKCFDKAGNVLTGAPLVLTAGLGGTVPFDRIIAEINLNLTSTSTNSIAGYTFDFKNPLGSAGDSFTFLPIINGQRTYMTHVPQIDARGHYEFLVLAPTGKSMTFASQLYDRSSIKGTVSNSISYTVGQSSTPPPPSSDTTKPVVSITSPVSGSVVTPSTTVSIQASASDNIGVTKVEFYVNNSLICTDTTAPYSCNWNVPRTKGASYSIEARAYDQAGNFGSHTISVTAGTTRNRK